MNFVQTLWKSLIAISLFITIVIVMGVVDTSLYGHSLEIIKEYSNEWNNSSLASFMKDYVMIGTILIACLGSFYMLTAGPKIGQLLWLNSVAAGLTLNGILNNIHHKIRPCWSDLTISVLGDNKTYGSPSENSTFCGCVLFGALIIYAFPNIDFFLSDAERVSVERTRKTIPYHLIARIAIAAISLAAYALLLYSEIYTGASTVDQMLYGLLLSMLCITSFFFFFRNLLVSFYKTALTGQQPLKIPMIVLGVVSIALLVVEIAIYFIQKAANIELDVKTIAHVQTKIFDFTSETPLSAGLIEAGLGFVAIGAHFGLLLQPKITKIDPVRVSMHVSILGKIGRLIFIIFMVIPLPYVMIVYFPENPGILYFWFKAIIPSLMIGFMFFVLGDFLMSRVGLLPKIHDKIKEDEKKINTSIAKVEDKVPNLAAPAEVLLDTREATVRNNVPST